MPCRVTQCTMYYKVSIPFNQGGKSYTNIKQATQLKLGKSQSLLIREANLTEHADTAWRKTFIVSIPFNQGGKSYNRGR